MQNLKNIIIILLITSLIVSCGNEGKKVKAEIENTSQSVKNAKNLSNGASEMKENIQQLRSMTPLTKEQWETWVPEKLLELPRTSSILNSMTGLGSCGLGYHISNKRIDIMVFDGAGEIGAGSVGVYMMSSIKEYNQEEEWGYEKSVVIDGIKMKESYRKSGDKYNLTMFYNNRFALDIETKEVNHEELEQIIKDLNISGLKNL